MPRKRSGPRGADRSGVILLVVIALLVLFALVGLAFVIYAGAQATASRIYREGEERDHADADPEMLMDYFLGELIYGSNNPASPFFVGNAQVTRRSLVPNMYGAAGNIVPFDESKGAVGYTYPDTRNMYLAAVKGGDLDFTDPGLTQRVTYGGTNGAVLIPSFVRKSQKGNPITLRAALPFPQDDAGGDVKNLASSPGFLIPGSGSTSAPPQFANNDSIWIDLGFPVMRAGDGTFYKPLFAALITDLDNRFNVNVHGNCLSNYTNDGVASTDGNYPYDKGSGATSAPAGCQTSLSHQGLGPWEVSPAWVFKDVTGQTARDGSKVGSPGNAPEYRRLFIGSMYDYWVPDIPGRYTFWSSNTGWNEPYGHNWNQSDENLLIRGPYYSPINGDALGLSTNHMLFPGNKTGVQVPSYSCFPYFDGTYEGWFSQWAATRDHPILYSYFSPNVSYGNYCVAQGYWQPNAPPNGYGFGQNYGASEMEALLRWGDTGSPALVSRLLRIMPQSLANPSTRRMLTTHSFDLDRPTFSSSLPTQLLTAIGGNGGNRINLNRDLPRGAMGNAAQEFWQDNYQSWANQGLWQNLGSYQPIQQFNVTDPIFGGSVAINTGIVPVTQRGFNATAIGVRQAFCQEIFNYACTLCGLPLPIDQSKVATYRAIAQIAVNIVDYIDIDDNITPFNWNPTAPEYVYGTELPRLVVNEVYAEIVNDPQDMSANMAAMQMLPLTNSMFTASMDYKVRFWVELNDPLHNTGVSGGPPQILGGQYYPMPQSEGGCARIQVPLLGSDPTTPYAVYKAIVCVTDLNNLPATKMRDPGNNAGTPDPATVMTQVPGNDPTSGFPSWKPTAQTPAAPPGMPQPYTPNLVTWGNKYAPWQDQINLVQGMDKYGKGLDEDNYGFYVIGPPDDFPTVAGTKTTQGVSANATDNPVGYPHATLRCDQKVDANYKPSGLPTNGNDVTKQYGLSFGFDKGKDPSTLTDPTKFTTSVVLQRLCCPSLPPNNTPGPLYNPYVTVDYMEGVYINQGVVVDSKGNTPTNYKAVAKRYSKGRSQPYGGHLSQQVPQKPMTALVNQPQHTFFGVNVQVVNPAGNDPVPDGAIEPSNNNQPAGFANSWLAFADRPLISPPELLLVSGYKPHELTQQFALGPNGGNGQPSLVNQHLINWFAPNAPSPPAPPFSAPGLYQLFEFVSARLPLQWQSVGGRNTGCININTVWDREIFEALGDAQVTNFFTANDVDRCFDKMRMSRSPGYSPGPGDKPFIGMGAGHTGGLEDTFFRTDPFDATKQRRLFQPDGLNPNTGFNQGHPFATNELMRKIFNNVTTRSNVFAVFLTVGFFEADPTTGALGNEVGRSEGRHVRHRLFSVVDRSNVTVAMTAAGTPKLPLQAGPAPIPLPALSPVSSPGATPKSVLVPSLNPTYDGSSWSQALGTGDTILVDPGPNQEILTVSSTGSNKYVGNGQGLYWHNFPTVSAIFRKAHPANFTIMKLQTGGGAQIGAPGGLFGNPGPQPYFSVRNPTFKSVVRHFNVIE